VLLSGGLDSATCLAVARDEGFVVHAISFRYGQRHDIELVAAADLAATAGVEHVIVDLDLRTFGGSALTADIAVPKHDTVDELGLDPRAENSIPITYVPARNTIFLSYALAFAEVRDARDVFIGVNALDYSGYPDCRPEYIEAFETMANLATRAGVTSSGADRLRIHTPLIDLTKAAIITRGIALGVDYAKTTSCYDPVVDREVEREVKREVDREVDRTWDPASSRLVWRACGHCDSCLLRRKGFTESGLVDPIAYVDQMA